MKIGKTFWWLCGLLIITTAAAIQPGLDENKIYLRLIITWGVVIVSGFIWTALSLLGIQVDRRSRVYRMQVGQTFIERFDIINKSILPKLWVKVLDGSDLPDSEASRMITSIKRKESRSYNTYSILHYRGIFQLGPTIISSGDVLGLFIIERKILSDQKLLVLPYFVDLSNFPAPYGALPGGRALRLKTTEVTPYSAGVREYMPGDPLRRIHWPTSARKQKLIVKEFEKDPLEEVWIFLDIRKPLNLVQNPEEQSQDGELLPWMSKRRKFSLPSSTIEYSISIAASLARFYLNRNREVGLSVFGNALLVIPSDRGERQLGKILDNLALIKPESEETLFAMVDAHLTSLSKGCTVILITSANDDSVMDSANVLLRRGIKPIMVLIDQETFGGAPGTKELHSDLEAKGATVITIANGSDLVTSLQKENSTYSAKY